VSACQHESFHVQADVGRILATDDGPLAYLALEITTTCTDCDTLLRVIDPEIPAGLLPGRVTTDPRGTQLRVPMWPLDGTEPPTGVLAGFTIRVR
jgi:hypothetical protein